MDMKNVQAFWDRAFEKSEARPPASTGSETLDRIIETTRHRFGRVLDVGCGNGKTLYLFATPEKGTYHGIDLSEEAIRKARELFRDASIDHAFFQGDVSLMADFNDASYDCILLFNILDNIEESSAKRVLKEARRLLDDQGVVLVKLNPYLDQKTLEAYPMKEVEKDFHLEPSGLYLLNKPDDYWLNAFESFNVKASMDIHYQDQGQKNRLFMLEKN